MTDDKRRESARKWRSKCDERKRAAGLKRICVWIPARLEQTIKKLIKERIDEL